uniref:Rho-GAP domain-containing protein n=1 Tax=Macrostomum lignano TaxID=282301 RepID=A0A1I8FAQ4_9PLAT
MDHGAAVVCRALPQLKDDLLDAAETQSGKTAAAAAGKAASRICFIKSSEKKRQETHHQAQQQVPASDQSVTDGASGGGVSGGELSAAHQGEQCQNLRQSCPQLTRAKAVPKATAELSAADAGRGKLKRPPNFLPLWRRLFARRGQDQVDAAEESAIVSAPEASPSAMLPNNQLLPLSRPRRKRLAEEESRQTRKRRAPQSEDVSNAAAGAAGPAASSTLGVANTKRQLGPYGLLSVREIFKQLIAKHEPARSEQYGRQNGDMFESAGPSLFEVAADSLEKCDCLLELVRNDLCKNLVFLELYLTRLMEIVTSEGNRVTSTELLSKNAFSTGGGKYSARTCCRLDALLTVIDCIEAHCNAAAAVSATKASASQKQPQQQQQQSQQLSLTQASLTTGYQAASGRCGPPQPPRYRPCPSAMMSKTSVASADSCDVKELARRRERRKLLQQGAEIVQQKSGLRGWRFLAKHKLAVPQLSGERGRLLRENPSLDKKIIKNRSRVPPSARRTVTGQYGYSASSSARRRLGANSARLFARSFNFAADRVDEASARLTAGGRFPPCAVAVRSSSMCLEQLLILRRGSTEQASFIRATSRAVGPGPVQPNLGPTVAALSHVFDKTADEAIVVPKAISGFRKCAMISAHYGLTDVFDNINHFAVQVHRAAELETGVFSSLYMSLFSDTSSSRAALSEELAARQRAAECIRECQLEQLGPAVRRAHSYAVLDEDACVVYFELLMPGAAAESDRLGPLWIIRVRSYSSRSYFYNVFSCLRLLILAKPSIPALGLPAGCVRRLHDLNQHARPSRCTAKRTGAFCSLCWRSAAPGPLPSLVYRGLSRPPRLPEASGQRLSRQQIGVEAVPIPRLFARLLPSSDGRDAPASTNADRPTPRLTPGLRASTLRQASRVSGGGSAAIDVRHGPEATAAWVRWSEPRHSALSPGRVAAPLVCRLVELEPLRRLAATVAAGTGGYDGQVDSDSSHWFT